ncbi:putative DNA methylase [Bradyrhizobium japonicum]
MNVHAKAKQLNAPVLQDAPALIERQLPVGRLSAEAYKERKAGAGQTLTAIGSYWKGRKPLILVRASILASLLPATKDPQADLRIFLKLMGMADESFTHRLDSVSAKDVDPAWSGYDDIIEREEEDKPRWRRDVDPSIRRQRIVEWLLTLPYDARLDFCRRPEDCDDELLNGVWRDVNSHLGTSAQNFPELVDQLGKMRFGQRVQVADTFSGGGAIPFEAARMGCDVYASDLNPIACMLTWGAFHIVGASPSERAEMESEQKTISERVEKEITKLGVEVDKDGNRAKAFLYCLETRCPKTGWMVPVSQSWLISTKQNAIARLVPDQKRKRYDIEIVTGVSNKEAEEAKNGTLREGRLVHPMNPDRAGVSIEVIRGDYRNEDGKSANKLRPWAKSDFMSREDDIFRERLYCVQWIDGNDFAEGKRHARTFFRSVSDEDLERDRIVADVVRKHLPKWQESGAIPDMKIEPGEKTDEPIRTRGWTYWHHLFAPRQLLLLGLMNEAARHPFDKVLFSNELNFHSKLCGIHPRTRGSGREMCLDRVFINQALNTLINYGVRSSAYQAENSENIKFQALPEVRYVVNTHSAADIAVENQIYVTDPPYADAVNYHEITEYFIAWLRKGNPAEFSDWIWDSQRSSAIKGIDEKFRSEMARAYKAMADHMPENGIQIVMFTHQDAGVWADLAAIMWAAGLRVTAAWNVVTETASARKEGNFVQGTILLVLRKRVQKQNGRRMDIEGEIEDEVKGQLRSLNAIDDDWGGEHLYTDGDLQLAAYAAALRVITSYETIDKQDVGADVFRKIEKGEKTVIRELIEYAASVANNLLVPDGFSSSLWRDLDPASRFYVRMLDMEHKGSTKFADFENFAKTFALASYRDLMGSTQANKACLAGAGQLKGKLMEAGGFGHTPLRRVLFAVYKTMQEDDPKVGLTFLKTEIGQDYWTARLTLAELADYLSAKTVRTRPDESAAANLVAEALRVDRL